MSIERYGFGQNVIIFGHFLLRCIVYYKNQTHRIDRDFGEMCQSNLINFTWKMFHRNGKYNESGMLSVNGSILSQFV